MSDYRKSKQHIEGVQNQKNNTEARCANQRKQLALMNAQIKNYKELLRECRGLLDNYNHTFETKDWEKSSNLITQTTHAIGEKK